MFGMPTVVSGESDVEANDIQAASANGNIFDEGQRKKFFCSKKKLKSFEQSKDRRGGTIFDAKTWTAL